MNRVYIEQEEQHTHTNQQNRLANYPNDEDGVRMARYDLARLVCFEDFAMLLTSTQATMTKHTGRTVYDVTAAAAAFARAYKLNSLAAFFLFVTSRYGDRVRKIVDFLFAMRIP